MRWKQCREPKPREVRERREFLWLPLCINDEWRWLEYALIKQKYCLHGKFPAGRYWAWDDISWLPLTGEEGPWR